MVKRNGISYSSCMTDIEIGRIIKEERQKRGLSQQELATKVGVTWEMISRYERGRSSALNKILEISDALEIEVGKFFQANFAPSHFSDASSEYLASTFIPVITMVPATVTELQKVLSSTEIGMRAYDDGEQVEKFGIRLGAESKIRIAANTLLPRGVLVCSLALGELTEQSLVVLARKGIVSVEQYDPSLKTLVMARVVEWIVKF